MSEILCKLPSLGYQFVKADSLSFNILLLIYPCNKVIGNYSIRIENKPSLLPNGEAMGVVLQNNSHTIQNAPGPAFPITGHPDSLTGYYKFAPLNGDTMCIIIQLYHNGVYLSGGGGIRSTAAVPNWTSFNIPISAYTAADSGTILLSAYNAGPTTVPYGNSVLNVDNLNFDNLITTGISEIGETGDVSIYPNPADEKLTIAFADNAGRQIDLAVFNTFGQQVFAQKIYNNTETIDISHFAKGIYFARLTSGSQTLYNKKIIITK